ncbi:MAG: Na+/H+ antiporter NhaA [Desulfocapsa sp.]|nr:Na+/H+ antiporter NhaA [Desulfocapsa sp.]
MIMPFTLKAGPRMLVLVGPFQKFVRKVATGGFLLFASTIIALIWANLANESYHAFWHTELSIHLGPYHISRSIQHWIDEALMTLFFFTVGLEIKREMLIGELASAKKALLPVAAAIGGMVVPAIIYTLLNFSTPGAKGWGIPMATDIAFALAVISLLSTRVPLGVRIFLSALAIADDIGAVLVIALFYTESIAWSYLLFALFFLGCIILANIFWVRYTILYVLLGFAVWFGILGSGIHATVAGVIVALCIPAQGRYDTATFIQKVSNSLDKFDCGLEGCGFTVLINQQHLTIIQNIENACHQTQTPLQRMLGGLNSWVALVILPLFALANAGVYLGGMDLQYALTSSITLGVMLGLVIGKPLGIFTFTFAASKLMKAKLTGGVTWLHIFGASMLGGIGFTMSIFISGLSFSEQELIDLSKFGVIGGSLISGIFGLAVLTLAGKKKNRS